MTEIVYIDDKQIIDLHIKKNFVEKNEKCKIVLNIEEIDFEDIM